MKNRCIFKKYAAELVLTVTAVLFLPEAMFAQGAVVGFAPYSSYDPQTPLTSFPSDEQLDRLTHVLPMIGVDSSTYTISKWNTNRLSWFESLVNRAHQKGVQVIISVSDVSENKFVPATNSQNRPNFVKDIVKFVQEKNLEGVDINWERPGRGAGTDTAKIITEWKQCIALLDTLKGLLPCKRISITIASSPPTSDRYIVNSPKSPIPPIPAQIWSAVDAIHLMTYDGESGWPTHSDAGVSNTRIDEWENWGTPRNLDKKKLFVACAFYGWHPVVGNLNGGSKVTYADIILNGSACANLGDNTTSVATKVNHCYNNGYGGVMIYELGRDIPDATNPNSLLYATWAANTAKGGYPAIAITSHPASITVVQGKISGSLSVVTNKSCNCNGNTYDKAIYQWYKNTINSNTNGTPVAGATDASFAIPTNLTANTYYYYCVVKGKNTVTSNVAAVTVTVPPVISGYLNVCYGTSKSFVATNWQTGYYWDKSNNLVTISSPTINSTAISAASSSSSGWETLYVKNSSGTILASYNITVYPAFPSSSFQGVLNATSSLPVLMKPPNAPGTVAYVWQISNNPLTPYCTKNYIEDYGLYAKAQAPVCGSHNVFAYAINGCGVVSPNHTHQYIIMVNHSSCINCIPSPSAGFPNPVSDMLNVDIGQFSVSRSGSSGQQAPSSNTNYDIRLYDGQENMLRQQYAKDGVIQFNVSNLPNGIYYLHIYDGVNSMPEIQQIVVQH